MRVGLESVGDPYALYDAGPEAIVELFAYLQEVQGDERPRFLGANLGGGGSIEAKNRFAAFQVA